ncbi:MCE family protein [Gordonia sp. GONU]|uniref:MlaD family protein n=1 Tax=Gordonia sp. GONU TaxID=2972949 RepID=UPI0021AD08A4|nr:MCE family protein [Gordonia sp. GONU]MCR8895977.1 MCE family protein [Gordonia sp. GONU]
MSVRTISLESEAGGPTDRMLLVRGLIGIAVIAAVVAALLLKSTGALDDRVTITALLTDVGDGIPAKSDVKFRGSLVGIVTGVEPGSDGEPNRVAISLDPASAQGIPDTVTARVVPSNVFAVSSVQLLDHPDQAGRPVQDGDTVEADTSRETIELQTVLTKLRDIVDAMGRDRRDDTVGVLAALATATRSQGSEIRTAGGQLVTIMTELNRAIDDGETRSRLSELATAMGGLQRSAPDLLDAVHHAIVPMQTVAEKQAALTDLLSAGQHTLGTSETALGNNTDRMITITSSFAPVLDVFADGGPALAPITVKIANLSETFMTEFWDPKKQRGTGHFVWALTPHRMYSRADCPRYGDLVGNSCQWAPATVGRPTLPQVLQPKNYRPPAGLMGGNVGPVGSRAEIEALRKLLGPGANEVTALLLGPLLRGSDIKVEKPGQKPDQKPGRAPGERATEGGR